jgi:hypothetical protein
MSALDGRVLVHPDSKKKAALAGLIAFLLLQEGGIKVALSSVNQKTLRSSVWSSLPRPDSKAVTLS